MKRFALIVFALAVLLCAAGAQSSDGKTAGTVSSTVTSVTRADGTIVTRSVSIATLCGVRGELVKDILDFTYTLNKTHDGAVITGIKKHPAKDYSIIIPEAVDGYPVVAVARMNIENHSPVCIVFADGVEEIADDACNGWEELESVKLPSGGTVGESAFSNCKSLTSVSIPNGAKFRYAKESAFEGCVSLPASVQARINISGYKGNY